MLSFFLLSMNYPLSCIHHCLSIFFFFWCLLPSFFRPLACVFPSKTHFSSCNEFFFLFRFFLFSALTSRLPSHKLPLLWPASPCLFYARWEFFFYTQPLFRPHTRWIPPFHLLNSFDNLPLKKKIHNDCILFSFFMGDPSLNFFLYLAATPNVCSLNISPRCSRVWFPSIFGGLSWTKLMSS